MRSPKRNVAAATLLGLLALIVVGLIRTNHDSAVDTTGADTSRALSAPAPAVDQSSLVRAEQLAKLPTSLDEVALAREALRLADRDMDLAFAAALRDAAEHPPVMSADVQAIDGRLRKAKAAVPESQARIVTLTAAAAKLGGSATSTLGDQLDLAKARLELEQDEVDDATQDLLRAGGDPAGRIQAMIDAHTAASAASDSTRVAVRPPTESHGLISCYERWAALRGERLQLNQARRSADSTAAAFVAVHDALDQRVAQSPVTSLAATAGLSHDSSAATLQRTKQRAADRTTLFILGKRIDDQQALAKVYASWVGVVGGEERNAVNEALRGIGIILLIALIGLFFDQWLEGLLGKRSTDGGGWHTLQTLIRVSLQILGVLLAIIVAVGPPSNLGTFLGLAGAGLTVALKDFIVGFFGWFVLMGKNGIRVADWVEINGVTGEVVDLGMFHTVLLETGEWTDSSHPTGRRVSFMNTFAIEGHYFNFSTSGQWLWDEVRFALPAGADLGSIADAMQKTAVDATAGDARQAEAEWTGATLAHGASPATAAPVTTIKPIIGGFEMTVRYVTRASDRAELRATLYHAAVDLLGGKALEGDDIKLPTGVRLPVH